MDRLKMNHEYVPVVIERKRVKNLSMRILLDGTIKMTAPLNLPEERIDEFILSKLEWIEKSEELQKKRRISQEKKSVMNPVIQVLGKSYHVVLKQGNHEGFVLDDRYMILTVKESGRVQQVFEKQARMMLEEIFQQKRGKLERILDDYRLPHPEISIRKMKGKWGSCTPSKEKIVMNFMLIHVPVKCIEYVLIHEYMHMIVPNHSKRFYELIENVMPDYKIYRKILKEE
ncbi:MAG: M48 family metallopeptidase [Erysipelotrichaceae bacterium]|nr:M48 family metallopeptidase [Erysipelotrichaceae bacterium]